MERNFDGIQFETFRRVFDTRFNEVHDELTEAYYSGQPFRTLGILTKEQFDALHALLWYIYVVKFHELNQRLPALQRIPELEYDAQERDGDTIIIRKSDVAETAAQALESMGYSFPDLRAL